jgi:hypothetical protein
MLNMPEEGVKLLEASSLPFRMKAIRTIIHGILDKVP